MQTLNEENVVATYDYYTLDQARNILTEEIKHEYKRKIAHKKRKERAYFLKQKCIGAVILFSIGIIYFVSKDILACLPFFGIGLACFTRIHLIYF